MVKRKAQGSVGFPNSSETSTMIEYRSITTYRDLLEALQQANEEQLDLPIQCVNSHPVDEYVYTLQQVICIGTVDALDLRYARSVRDNRCNGEELVLFSDGNPHAEDGAVSYAVDDTFEGEEPFRHHDQSTHPITMRAWTGQGAPKNSLTANNESGQIGRLRTFSRIGYAATDSDPAVRMTDAVSSDCMFGTHWSKAKWCVLSSWMSRRNPRVQLQNFEGAAAICDQDQLRHIPFANVGRKAAQHLIKNHCFAPVRASDQYLGPTAAGFLSLTSGGLWYKIPPEESEWR